MRFFNVKLFILPAYQLIVSIFHLLHLLLVSDLLSHHPQANCGAILSNGSLPHSNQSIVFLHFRLISYQPRN
jgi:hypothetical protein